MTHEDWQQISASLRIEIVKRIPDMAIMKPDELKSFVATVRDIENFEMATDSREERFKDFIQRLEIPWKES